jgi:hypothetical protein
MLWILVAIAGVGSLAIKFIASAQVARARGTTALEESFFGWRRAKLIGLPAPLLFYSWFLALGGFGIFWALWK